MNPPLSPQRLYGKCLPAAILFLALLTGIAAPSFAQQYSGGLPLVLDKGAWTVLSPVINDYTQIARTKSGETWLATPIGIKRAQGENRRFYTTSDGVPKGAVAALVTEDGNGDSVWCATIADRPCCLQVAWFDTGTDRWIALPELALSDSIRLTSNYWPSNVTHRAFLAVTATRDVYAAISSAEESGFGIGQDDPPVTAIWHFDWHTRGWHPMSAPVTPVPAGKPTAYHAPLPRLRFFQATPDGGLFAGTTTGLYRWDVTTGWLPVTSGHAFRAGARGRDGDWWLVGNSPSFSGSEPPELFHIDRSGSVLSRTSLPVAAVPGTRLARLRDINVVLEETESVEHRSASIWVIRRNEGYEIGSDMGPPVLAETSVAQFDRASGKMISDTPLRAPADMKALPDIVLAPLLIDSNRYGLYRPQRSVLSEALHQRFAAFDNPSATGIPHLPERNEFPPYRGVAGTDADGSVWDSAGADGIAHITAKGPAVKFPLPPILQPVYADLAGVTMMPSGTLLALNGDALLRHPASSTTELKSWSRVTVPYESLLNMWTHYDYTSRLITHGDGAWLSTSRFAAHFDGSGRYTGAFVSNQPSWLQLLGIRADDTAWTFQHDSQIAIIGTGGKEIRQIPPTTSDASSRYLEVGGTMDDILWRFETPPLRDGRMHDALVGDNTRTGKSTARLDCYPVFAIRSGIDGAAASEQAGSPNTVWALVSERGKQNTLRLYMWNPTADTWATVGPELPNGAHWNEFPLRILRARPDDIWIADRDDIVLFHWGGHSAEWTTILPPPGSGERAGNSAADAGVYAWQTLDGKPGAVIYLAGIDGLWEYRIGPAVWRHLPVASLGTWSISHVADGGPNAAWALLFHAAGGPVCSARFDKKTHVWTVYGAAEGFPTRPEGDYLTPDERDPSHCCWYVTRERLYRFDGHRWRDRTNGVTGGNSAIQATRVVAAPSGDAWIVIGALPQRVPLAQMKAPGATAPLVAHWNRKTDTITCYHPASANARADVQTATYGTCVLPQANGDVILGTTHGAYRMQALTGQWSPLAIPEFPNEPIDWIAQTPDGLWLYGPDLLALQRE